MSIRQQLQDLLDAGRQMLIVARQGDWDRAQQLQLYCHERAQALFSEPHGAPDAEALARAGDQLLEMHREVRELCTHARADYMREIDDLNQGRQAITEYTANSG